ncbi:MAG: hypothetical protein A2162_01750 [Deltaproteobacteria bacterium RBG_13_52_11b]|nr:MAG: hypothetical protein A2162_01750 [Deltaproteobacteria bacterium RBG_13_52_11b]
MRVLWNGMGNRGFTETEDQQRQWTVVLHIQKVPLQGFFQCSHRVWYGVFSVTLKIEETYDSELRTHYSELKLR